MSRYTDLWNNLLLYLINMYVRWIIQFALANKRLLIIILVLAGIYFVLLPLGWPDPKITISVQNADHTHNISDGTVSVHTWHSNISLFSVNGIFNVDKNKNNGNAVIARSLLPEKNQKRWDSLHTFGINRWTWPRVYNFKLELPIEELRNKTDSDYVTGRIYARVRFPNVYEGSTSTSERAHVERVKIILWE